MPKKLDRLTGVDRLARMSQSCMLMIECVCARWCRCTHSTHQSWPTYTTICTSLHRPHDYHHQTTDNTFCTETGIL